MVTHDDSEGVCWSLPEGGPSDVIACADRGRIQTQTASGSKSTKKTKVDHKECTMAREKRQVPAYLPIVAS